MIAVDTSALIAIIFAEPERPAFLQAIQQCAKALISTVSVVETRRLIYGPRGHRGVVLADDLLALPIFELVAPASRQWMPRPPPSSPMAKAAVTRPR
jgi:ribonuclease VapC